MRKAESRKRTEELKPARRRRMPRSPGQDYDYHYVFGEGGHNGNHGGVILPDTMRWLWRDYPK